MSATVRPLGDRVLVRVIPIERKTTGGVILPDQAREVTDRGLVIAVGPGKPVEGFPPRVRVEATYPPETEVHGVRLVPGETVMPMVPVPVSVDEVVLFSPYAGSKLTVEGEDFLLLREHDVLGVLDGVRVVDEDGVLRIADPEPATV